MAIHPSLRLAILLLLMHLVATLALYVTPLQSSVRLALFLPVLASLTYHLARDALLLLPASWRKLSIGDDAATIVTRDGTKLTGQLAGGCVVTPVFVMLRVKLDGKRRPVARAIFPDALGGEAFRELCVRLRYH